MVGLYILGIFVIAEILFWGVFFFSKQDKLEFGATISNLNGYLIILGTLYGITEIALFLSLGISRIPLVYAHLLNPKKAWDHILSDTLKIH